MIDFIEYVVGELKSKRLSKSHALALIKQFSSHSMGTATANVSSIHPLLHRNTSDLRQQSYSSSFTGREFFLRDHRVHGKSVMPAVAYLEMIRAALADALPERAERTTLELRNVAWVQPLVVTGPHKEVAVALSIDDQRASSSDHVDFEIYSAAEGELLAGDATDELIHCQVHCQGQALFTAAIAPPRQDIESLQAQMIQGRLEAARLYPAIAEVGIDIGPSHQGIKTIYQGERQQLVQISLPQAVQGTHDDYVLHPSILDSVLQAATGLLIDLSRRVNQPPIPFALESLQVFAPCRQDMFAWARYTPGSEREANVAKLDIDLCDVEGNVCVSMRGFSSRVLSTEIGESQDKEIGCLLAVPQWQAVEAVAAASVADEAEPAKGHIVLCDMPGVNAKQLIERVGAESCLELKITQQTIAGRYGEVALACFETLRTVLEGLRGKAYVQLVVAHTDTILTGLSGLLKTATLENPQLLGQIVVTAPDIAADALARELQEARRRPHEAIVKYQNGEQRVLRWRAFDESHDANSQQLAFKDDGVYLITGGLGGLGALFARDILKQTSNARVILTGRSTLTTAKQALLEELSAGREQRVTYRQLTLGDLEQVRHFMTGCIEEFGHLNGIIHSAGMIADAFILKKTAEELTRVLEPKVTGTFNLDEASQDIDLDFMALFSAGAAVHGNAGQADYAAANGFMDQFAGYRNQLVAANARQGRTVSINWPLWQHGGMSIDATSLKQLQRVTGMHPMQTQTGLWAFQRCLASQRNQMLVVEGELDRVHRALLAEPEFPAAVIEQETAALAVELDSGSLIEKTQHYLRKQFSLVLKLPAQKIEPLAPLEKYGIDSILAMSLTNQLELAFGSLPKTLFFEYRSVRELAEHLIGAYPEKLASLFAATVADRPSSAPRSAAPAQSVTKVTSNAKAKATRRFHRRREISDATTNAVSSSGPIAIVGLSGRYPESIDIDAYWRNLRDGKDCIVEVPQQRWDWRELYTEDRTQPGYHYSKWGGFIVGVDEFDPLFFNISPREARLMDPQERLFLQHAWMAVEDAGYTRAGLQVPHQRGLPAQKIGGVGQVGQVGVYVGVMYGEYNLSGSLAGIANRVSSVLNLHGPSMALDTMCSSSLTAIHLACQDLKQGRTDVAIAGGVNVSIHPSKYLMLSAGQFISSDGHCQSFGEGGDGYIPGEGVGAVVLKRLADAERDGDCIHGIIKGSALNHGGRTNGYTVPNPQAQASVISQALAEANTSPRQVTYLEAHGTGTKLGDPIEIAALSKAFYAGEGDSQTRERGFCAIGSAKSNIGHCESAAGIAGLTKVLLQMRHRQIVPSLHSVRLNPHIDFERSPFVVNQSLRDWDRPTIDGRELPRTAGLSSFGAGGSNAHVVIEEYIPLADFAGPAMPERVIVPLSARTAEQLRQRVVDLLKFIRSNTESGATLDLAALGYTLQVGREALEERVGFVVASLAQLAEKLQAYLDHEPEIEGVFQGQVKQHRETLSSFDADPDFQDTVDKWIVRKQLAKLVDLWVKGLALNWRKLYGEVAPRRISLPTYPFAKEKYWIETVGQVVQSAVSRTSATTTVARVDAKTAVLHPLLHVNTSDLSGQQYSTRFDGEETFFSAPRVGEIKTLMAVAYLEMARAAISQATRIQPESSILELTHIVWGQPLPAAANREVIIALGSVGGERVHFDIYSPAAGKDQESVHCQGQAAFGRQPAPARLDVAQMKARLESSEADVASVYSGLAGMGLQYGLAHQAITATQRGKDELLAKVRLPTLVADGLTDYILHPSVMDGAVQACLAFAGQALSPVSLDSVRIFQSCPPEGLVWVRSVQGKMDLDLCDPQGNVCVQMRGLTLQSRVARPAITVMTAKPQSIQLNSMQAADAVISPAAVTRTKLVALIDLQEVVAPPDSLVAGSIVLADEASQQSLDSAAQEQASDVGEDEASEDESASAYSLSELQRQLRASLAAALYMEMADIDNEKSFVDLGLDSIVGVEWVKVINRQHALNIAATRVYDYPNVKELASFVAGEIAQRPAALQAPVAKPAAPKRVAAAPIAKPSTLFSGSYPLLTRMARGDGAAAKMYAAPSTLPVADKIAIVGMSGRYPQANNLRQYWDNLAQGKNSVVEIPPSRWDVNDYYDPEPGKKGKVYCKSLGMLDDVECFDPLFFQISPAEAQNMDPQHRLFMQEAYRAFEDAGYSNRTLSNKKCGVYLGIMSNEYSLLLARDGSFNADATGTSYAIGAARIAYHLNLKGPAIPIDTACSSSLVSIHLACQALLNREIDMALAGGVTLYLTADSYQAMCHLGMLSPDGQCKTFDNSADGFVPGEGVGAVVLKRLQDAEADNDCIYGVILGSAVNQDGKTNGITAPSVSSQIELERDLYARYKIDPETISYVETHGTGTKLGDPIELEALATVFGEQTPNKNYCALGSVKTNIGHTSGAAGVASVHKVLLSMRHQTLAPSLHVTTENALFDFKNSPFYICRERQDWRVPAGSPRRAAVSSFGFSGTNAHLVLEEYSPRQVRAAVSPLAKVAVLLSARTPAQLQQRAQDLLEFVQREQAVDLASLAYTLQVGREAFKERLGVVVNSVEQLAEKLSAHLSGASDIENIYLGQAGRDKDALAVFSADPDLQETVNKWLAHRKFSSLVDLWAKGLEVNWNRLYSPQSTPRRLGLPTYPFAKERYWPKTSPSAPHQGSGASVQTAPPAANQRLSYVPRWENDVLESSASTVVPAAPLLILDTTDELFTALRDQHSSAVLVKAGASFEELAPNVFTIDIERAADFQQLTETLRGRGQLPQRILHRCFDSLDVGTSLDHGIYALFHLCQALMSHKHQARVQILSIFCSEPGAPIPQHAALAGFFKTLMLENPKYMAKVVDIQGAASTTDLARLAVDEFAVKEFREQSWRTTEIRYQQQSHDTAHRLVRQGRQLVRQHLASSSLTELPLKHQGVYLVTGGLGGLGFIFCEYLARNFQARLVLLGRSALTPVQSEQLQRLRSHQPDTIYLQADVSKLGDVEQAVQAAKARFTSINGVIHAAGVNKDSFILKKGREDMATVLAAKVFGTTHLDRATSGESLDLFVMFSSVAATFGNAGQADYAYGNAFVDSFAERREALRNKRERSGRTLSINWPFWAEGGMTLSASDASRTEAQSGLSPLPTQEGLRYWEEILRSDLSQVVALYGDPARIETHIAGISSRPVSQALATSRLSPAELLTAAQNYLRQLIGAEIRLSPEQIDVDERFEAFGIDSIVVGRLNATLARDLGELPKTLFYEYETIAEFAKYLAEAAQHGLMRVGRPVDTTEEVVAASEPDRRPPQNETEQIAIIGVHGYYPGSEDLDQYWEHLRTGADLVGAVPANRWDAEALYHSDPDKAADGKIYCKSGGFLEHFDKFDAPFFNIPAEEARIIDPQERLFLSSVWSALEDAGYTRDSLKRLFPKAKSADVGVFVGVTTNSYHLLAAAEWSRGNITSPSALPWSIANRVSYFFDFQGPSLPIDTACSSSLVALHLACESLKKQECQVAIAGGVNLYLHPAKYHSFCQRRMLATNGKCRSFGAGDDGFVPGEGVGTLVLKSLSKAIEHGDHIYAVVAASAFDHSGRSNGYSAPNPNSQASLISRTLQKAGIHPETIGYVEGHGTGTQLGDSLEIAALAQAFSKQTDKRQFCAVGSVKANLGHSESAAGIAGVTKILLQMKHRQLAPSIHSDQVNPNIEFDTSPFYLQHGLTPWRSSTLHPRRALINSFGAGGVNACVVLEEHEQSSAAARLPAVGPFLVVLSAKTEDRLREYAMKLLAHVTKTADLDLGALTYTLQVGRESMPERLATVVADLQDLSRKLRAWSSRETAAGVHRGSLDPRRGAKKPCKTDAVEQTFEQLAQAWTAGEDIDWNRLYSHSRPARISLPVYPFAKERHWVSDSMAPKQRSAAASNSARLHPLVSYNSSTLEQISFQSVLSVNEFYARDHKVNGQMIFPGAGFLEMACVCGTLAGTSRVAKIQDVVWMQPLVFSEDPQRIHISLQAADGKAAYSIASYDEDHEKVVHSEGVICYSEGATEVEEYLPIEALRAQCSERFDGAHYYDLFEKSGISYGPAFRTLQELHIGDAFALSRLQIAAHLVEDFDEFLLHPCIVDGALQTVSGLLGGMDTSVPYLPFAIEEVAIVRSTSPACYVHVQLAGAEQQGNAEVRKFDIRIATEQGLVLAKFRNFSVRSFKFTPSSRQLSSS